MNTLLVRTKRYCATRRMYILSITHDPRHTTQLHASTLSGPSHDAHWPRLTPKWRPETAVSSSRFCSDRGCTSAGCQSRHCHCPPDDNAACAASVVVEDAPRVRHRSLPPPRRGRASKTRSLEPILGSSRGSGSVAASWKRKSHLQTRKKLGSGNQREGRRGTLNN